MTTQLDRDRLLRDLRAAADETEDHGNGNHLDAERVARIMARAYRLIAAAIEDGEYDLVEVPR